MKKNNESCTPCKIKAVFSKKTKQEKKGKKPQTKSCSWWMWWC